MNSPITPLSLNALSTRGNTVLKARSAKALPAQTRLPPKNGMKLNGWRGLHFLLSFSLALNAESRSNLSGMNLLCSGPH